MRRYLPGIVLALLPLVATATEGQEWYLGGGIGVSRMNPNTSVTPYSVEDKYDLGGKLFAGYALSDKLSLEGYYADLGSADIAPMGRIGYRDMGVSAVYVLYRNGEGSRAMGLFLRGGAGRMLNESSLPTKLNNDRHLMLGAGAVYPLNSDWTLRADLDLYDRDAQLFTVALVRHFATKAAQLPVIEEPVPLLEPQPEPEVIINPDLDGDGIANEDDLCPDTPAESKVDVSGCKLETVIVLKGVEFASNSDKLIGDSQSILDDVAKTLLRYPEQLVEVAGYTDSQGAADYNEQLSSRRANAVRTYLIAQGVSGAQLSARGYGETSPIAGNETAEGRAKNRRVELHLAK